MSKVVKFLTDDKTIRASAIISTDIVREICNKQEARSMAKIALGRVTTGAILFASNLKSSQHIGLHFDGDGPLGGVFAEATFEGKTRAYCSNPNVMFDENDSSLSVARGIGKGNLHIVYSLPNKKNPYRGTVEIQTGEIGDDLAYYLHQSKQTPSIVAVGTTLNEEGDIKSAYGILIELMPGVTEESIEKLEKSAQSIKSITKVVEDGANCKDLVNLYLKDFGLVSIPHEHDITFQCQCSHSRMKRSISLLGYNPVNEMINKGEPVYGKCDFCGQKYHITEEDLHEIKSNLKEETIH